MDLGAWKSGAAALHPASRSLAGRPLAVAVVTYNSADVLPGLLDSLADGLKDIAWSRIIIADNASSDESVALASAHPAKPEVILMGRNAGYSAGINAVAAAAGPEADLLVLNPDIRLLPGSARLMQARLGERVGVVAPRILKESGETAHSLRREPTILTTWSESLLGGRRAARLGLGGTIVDDRLYAEGGAIDWATGAALMISAAARSKVGEWDESFFLYSEEVDYMRRVRESGLTVEYAPEAAAVHIGGDYQRNPFLSGLMATNRIRDYGRRHGPFRTACFRAGVVAGEALRFFSGPGHRAAFMAALMAGTH